MRRQVANFFAKKLNEQAIASSDESITVRWTSTPHLVAFFL
jgi:hypothetical protein